MRLRQNSFQTPAQRPSPAAPRWVKESSELAVGAAGESARGSFMIACAQKRSSDRPPTKADPRLKFLSASTPRSRHTAPSPSDNRDRKSTRLNSSHSQISYAVFCLKKKKKK